MADRDPTDSRPFLFLPSSLCVDSVHANPKPFLLVASETASIKAPTGHLQVQCCTYLPQGTLGQASQGLRKYSPTATHDGPENQSIEAETASPSKGERSLRRLSFLLLGTSEPSSLRRIRRF